MAQVPVKKFEEWKLEKWTGLGATPAWQTHRAWRIGAHGLDFVDGWYPQKEQWPMLSPLTVLELFDVVKAAGKPLVQYDGDGRRQSGVAQRGIIARFHAALVTTFSERTSVSGSSATRGRRIGKKGAGACHCWQVSAVWSCGGGRRHLMVAGHAARSGAAAQAWGACCDESEAQTPVVGRRAAARAG